MTRPSQPIPFDYTPSKEYIEFQQKLTQSLTDKIKDFWHYKEADVYVPANVHKILSIDKTNIVSISAQPDDTIAPVKSCIIPSTTPYTVTEYREKFCTKMDDRWVYTNTEQSCPTHFCVCSN